MKPVVVIGRNYSTTLGVVRSLGIAGYDVWLLHTAGSPKAFPFIAAKSKFVVKYMYVCNKDEDNIIHTLLTYYTTVNQKLVIIPADDVSTLIIDTNANRLSEYFYLPSVNKQQGGIARFMDKSEQKKLALKCGFDVAQSSLVSLRGGKYELPDDMIFPCITKPVFSNNSKKTDLKTCNNVKELQEALSRLAERGDYNVLIEELLSIDREYTITGYAWGKHSFFPYVIKKLRTAINHRGVTSIGELHLASEFQVVENLQRFMSELCYYGLCDIEIIESKGRFYFNEMNLRMGAPLFAITLSGINLPDILIKRYMGDEYSEKVPKYETPPRFVSEKAEYDDYLSGDITYSQYKQHIADTDFALMRWNDDPEPYNMFERMVMKTVWSRKIPVCRLLLKCYSLIHNVLLKR